MDQSAELIGEIFECRIPECGEVFEYEDEAWNHAQQNQDHRIYCQRLYEKRGTEVYETFWIPPFTGYFG